MKLFHIILIILGTVILFFSLFCIIKAVSYENSNKTLSSEIIKQDKEEITTSLHIDSMEEVKESLDTTILNSSRDSDEQWEFLKDFAILINYADVQGYKLTVGELYRTMYQQRHYIKVGLSQTYNSRHLKRRAGDLNLFINGKFCGYSNDRECQEAYKDLGSYWKSLNPKNVWGGDWKSIVDEPHFERGYKERKY